MSSPFTGMRAVGCRTPMVLPRPATCQPFGGPARLFAGRCQARRPADVTWRLVLVLLPPSETKAPGGSGAPLDLDALSSPALTPVRARLVDALVALAADPPTARAALGLSAQQDGEIARNAALLSSRTAPALERYTGVLYDALDVRSMTKAQRSRAAGRLAVGSALFGLVRDGDAIPAYRLSAGSQLPGLPTLRALWKPVLAQVLDAVDDLVVDLRSGSYAALPPGPRAAAVTVLRERAGGARAAV